jgi:hypothetical protein
MTPEGLRAGGENEYFYDWHNSSGRFVGCDYIQMEF